MDEPTTPATKAAPEPPAADAPSPAPAAAIAIPSEVIALAEHMGVSPNDVSPLSVLQYVDKLKSDLVDERSNWERLFKEQADKHSLILQPLRLRLETAWNHIRSRAQNGSAPDQEFARTHAL